MAGLEGAVALDSGDTLEFSTAELTSQTIARPMLVYMRTSKRCGCRYQTESPTKNRGQDTVRIGWGGRHTSAGFSEYLSAIELI